MKGWTYRSSLFLGMKDNVKEAHEYSADQVLDFWFEDCQSDPKRVKLMSNKWYGGDVEFDSLLKERFGELYNYACYDYISSWGDTAEGALALVIIFDQFSRQIHRKSAAAFAQDAMARAVAKRTIQNGLDKELSVPGRLFLLHPFQHSEYLEDQEQGVGLVEQILDESATVWEECIRESLKYFIGHREIIRKYGRFPHRNEVLGRSSTPEELEYLVSASRFGQ